MNFSTHQKIFSLLSLFIFIFFNACGPSLKVAEEAFKEGRYPKSIAVYQKLLLKDEFKNKIGRFNYQIAESYRLSGRMKEALPFYEKADKAKFMSNNLGLYLGQALLVNGKYEEAKNHYQRYAKLATTKEFAQAFTEQAAFLDKIDTLQKRNTYTTVKPVVGINTPADEFTTALYQNQLVFTSNRRKEAIFDGNGKGYNDIYIASQADSLKVELFGGNLINLNAVNDEHATFSADGNTIVFARSATDKAANPNKEVMLYVSTLTDGVWSAPEPIRAACPRNTINITPFLSADGKTLYFASNRAGGAGGFDLYKSTADAKGKFGAATALPKDINTIGDEISPYLTEEGKLYFASDGHLGLGGLDIYEAAKINGKTVLKNLGSPINTAANDYAIIWKDAKNGYFTSNRKGQNAVGGDDIYEFFVADPPKYVYYYIAGKTFIDQDSTETKLEGVEVKLTDIDGKVLDLALSDASGNFKCFPKINTETIYKLQATKKGYLPQTMEYSTVGKGIDSASMEKEITEVVFSTQFVLKPDLYTNAADSTGEIILSNVTFATADTLLTQNAKKELDRVAEYLKIYTQYKVEVNVFSDETKDKKKNQVLTESRARQILAYLTELQISAERVAVFGWGDTKPRVKKPKTDAEKKINKRVAIKFIDKTAEL
jgi:peptidoglycan-associated lipoprotein